MTTRPHDHPVTVGAHQHYACEQPENPDIEHVLWFLNCDACRTALEAHRAAHPTLVVLAHGSTWSQQ